VDGPKRGYITVFAESDASLRVPSWNAGSCCQMKDHFIWEQRDDVAYFDRLIDIMLKTYPVDRNRIYVSGYSNGGYMTYRLACELSHRIRAVAPFAASLGMKQIPNNTKSNNFEYTFEQ
jgi:polyhydroxybutyrate depolymerase